jgi:hypothetical protein
VLYGCFQKYTYSFEVSQHITRPVHPGSVLHLHIDIKNNFISSMIFHLPIKIVNENISFEQNKRN